MEYLKRFALWFVSGVAFAIGATLVISGSDHLKRQSTPNIKESNVALEKIAISEVEISGLTKHLTVTGNVTNNSEKSLRDARILIQLVRGEKVLFECDDSLSNYPEPGKTLRPNPSLSPRPTTAGRLARAARWFMLHHAGKPSHLRGRG
jgi:hypothetical protein